MALSPKKDGESVRSKNGGVAKIKLGWWWSVVVVVWKRGHISGFTVFFFGHK
jgi:hypothetical protein